MNWLDTRKYTRSKEKASNNETKIIKLNTFCYKKRVRAEIDAVLGSRNQITNEDLNSLPYLSCVIKETLRLWPPANGTMRLVNEDFKINGLKIPKGTFMHVKLIFIQLFYDCVCNFDCLKKGNSISVCKI